MSTQELPTVAVLGACGPAASQGGSTARALLASGRFAVRALTRRPASPAALALRRLGAEVIQADLDDAASLRRALGGAQGLFAATPYWTHHSADREFEQARRLADAAAAAEVPHVVWSTQEDTRRWVLLEDAQWPTLGGRWKVPHMDAKGAANELFRERGVPTTRLAAAFFWDDLVRFGLMPRRAPDGRLVFPLPMGERALPGMAMADIGPIACALLSRPERWVGKAVGVAGAHLTGRAMADGFARALGEAVHHHSPQPDVLAARPLPGASGVANMFRFQHDFCSELRALRPVAATRELHPGLLDFDGWLAQYRRDLALAQLDHGAAHEAGLQVA
jgi:uncharacterized protein YbjT (DUF2867 family)